MLDILVLIALILGIFLARKGSNEKSKIIKYAGYIVIVLCLTYIVPEIVQGFIEGYRAKL